jgi:hypothetical protein
MADVGGRVDRSGADAVGLVRVNKFLLTEKVVLHYLRKPIVSNWR